MWGRGARSARRRYKLKFHYRARLIKRMSASEGLGSMLTSTLSSFERRVDWRIEVLGNYLVVF